MAFSSHGRSCNSRCPGGLPGDDESMAVLPMTPGRARSGCGMVVPHWRIAVVVSRAGMRAKLSISPSGACWLAQGDHLPTRSGFRWRQSGR